MAVYKEEKTGTWRVIYRYTDWTGERKQTQKRGFKAKRDAQAWEREQQNKATSNLDMTFASFVEQYTADMRTRLKENTWATKEHIIRSKLLPYFGRLKMCNITAQQIITWQNELLNFKDKKGKPYSPVYLKTVHNQLSAIFNHAVRYYNLRENPCKKAGSMGKKKNREMLFWTKAEYLKFAEAMMDKPLSYYAFEMLYWCGIREGELLALTPADFDFEKCTVSISKSYQRLNGQDLITAPKTEKSNRVITMPQFLADEMQDYLKMLYDVGENDRIFTVTKSYLHREMDRGAKEAGVKRIRIHDIRHSAVSLLIDMGFSAKNLDSHNRWRNKTVAFRVSPEEDAQIETAVQLTGLTKQDYIIRRLLNRDVVVQGNPRVYKALRDQFAAVLDELRRIEAGAHVSDELLDTISMIAAIMDGMKED